MSMASRVAQRYSKKACSGNPSCSCGCGGPKVKPLQVDAEIVRLADGENYMSVQSLQAMADHANSLLGKINESTDLPDWVEAKIIRAAASLEDVMEFFEHGWGQRLARKFGSSVPRPTRYLGGPASEFDVLPFPDGSRPWHVSFELSPKAAVALQKATRSPFILSVADVISGAEGTWIMLKPSNEEFAAGAGEQAFYKEEAVDSEAGDDLVSFFAKMLAAGKIPSGFEGI